MTLDILALNYILPGGVGAVAWSWLCFTPHKSLYAEFHKPSLDISAQSYRYPGVPVPVFVQVLDLGLGYGLTCQVS